MKTTSKKIKPIDIIAVPVSIFFIALCVLPEGLTHHVADAATAILDAALVLFLPALAVMAVAGIIFRSPR